MAHRRLDALLVLAVALVALLAAAPAYGQFIGPEPPPSTTSTTTTTTTAPPPTTTTTAPPPTLVPPSPGDPQPAPDPEPQPAPPGGGQPPAGSDQAPPPDGGDDGGAGGGPRTVPPEAQAIIDSIPRSAANSSRALYDAVQALVELGLSPEEAIRVGFGRFPVAGVATFIHDWYFPRWGPGFRFHMGTDVFAAQGTPLRSPVDGTASAGNGGLGGLYVKVFQPDGSYFYFAHMSALPEGFQDGMAVKTGDIVGYVGSSGNARGGKPHLHLGIYDAAGRASDPKPVLDQMLADALAALPGIVEQVRAQQPVPEPAAPPAPRVPRSLLATSLLRPLVDARIASGIDAAVLFEAVGNPASGGLAVAEAEVSRLASAIDWDARAARTGMRRQLAERVQQVLGQALGPLAP